MTGATIGEGAATIADRNGAPHQRRPAPYPSAFFSSSFTTPGLALPPIAFMV
jgi:hypothetical protein